MPKLIVTMSEMREELANRYGLPAACVEITPDAPNPYAVGAQNLTPSQIVNELRTIMRESRTSTPNKIALIKAYRTISGFGLKDSKDAVESALWLD